MLREDLLRELSEKYGTPLYVYDASIIRENFRKLKKCIDMYFKDYSIAYAYKANSNVHICRILHSEGADAEVVSAGELYLALMAGAPRVVFNGVSKSLFELSYAVENHVWLLNAESLDELVLLDKVAGKAGVKQFTGVRVNPGISVATHKHIRTGGREHKFGIPLPQLSSAVKLCKNLTNVELGAVHFHLGSQILQVEPYLKAVETVFKEIYDKRLTDYFDLKLLDIGGGFGVPYGSGRAFDFNELFSKLRHVIEYWCDKLRLGGLTLVVEPGRILVANAGVLLTRVNYVKEVYGKKWVLVDAGMNDFLRPMLYGAKHKISVLGGGEKVEVYSIGGPICESSDVFAENVELPAVSPGDILVIHDVGAYGYSMASNYNARPRPAEVLVDEGEAVLIRRRETLEDLARLFTPLTSGHD